jgi:uncharacterized protein (DUF952 family)
MIYHVVTKKNWQAALAQGWYEADSLSQEGFIHACKKHQADGVLERYYVGVQNLLLLHIDETRLTAPLKYEMSPTVSEEFPHIYGAINIEAVVKITDL